MTRSPEPGQPKPQSLAPCSARHAGLWLLRRLRRYRVVGESMVPTLLPGQSVLVDPRAFRKRLPGVGELVQLRDPRQLDRMLLKRVRSVEGARVFVLGDNASKSTDSREFGSVPLEWIQGRVVCAFTGSN